RDDAQIHFVVRVDKQVASPARQVSRASHDPEERARVEQQLHGDFPVQASSSTSDKGSKKAGATSNRPRANPTGRRVVRRCGTGRSSATGTFRLQRITVSPAATLARYLERCVFAS